ncbi:hypothetical protein [Croceicoccus marinus]|uniref:Uncharacterized protein n=1 Tax=Croceicoccus marinus TaxID=450378 RepID=A0A7G6VS26_9SPHN|nr:hypothetical protein [Croceicoccus marinus]QNE04541.1 hypothetical protein H4O24_11265 [Croceicoccus marinus]
MYRFLDRHLADLDEGARITVDAVRKWVTAVAERKCPADAVAPLFLDRRLIGAMAPFHRALTLLAVYGRMQLGFARECCPVVAEGEALLLSLLDRTSDRRRTCLAAVNEPYVEALQQAVMELEAAMQVAGLAPGSAGR